MILSGLFTVLKGLLSYLVVLLPTYSPPPGVGLSALAAADFILPLSELGLLFGALAAYVVASLGYVLIVRVVNWVRGAG